MIAIVNLNMGNLASVKKALDYWKVPAIITSDANDMRSASKIILPGVGSFAEASKNLRKLDLREALRHEALEKKKPILGICLGMQLLADEGEEGGVSQGLGMIPGRVVPITRPKSVRIPHVGWNDVQPDNSPLYQNIPEGSCFYFVHSYHFVPSEVVSVGLTDYVGSLVASVAKNNIFGTQFHPEKSQQVGLSLLKNFLDYDG